MKQSSSKSCCFKDCGAKMFCDSSASGANLRFLFFTVVISALLIFAYVLQHVFHITPCILCLYERWPYFIVVALGVLGFFAKEGALKRTAFYAIGLTLGAEVLITLYHVLVEHHIAPALPQCRGVDIRGKSFEEAKALLLQTPLAACDAVSFRILGLSLAAWNLITSTGLLGLFLVMQRKSRKS